MGIDNEALFSISHNVLKQKEPKYSDLNWVISMVMSGITASLRFSGKLHGDLRKMGVNLVPFPRLHFFLLAPCPLFAPGQGDKVKLTVQELTDQMWSSRNFLANVKAEDGKYLTASCGYRGAIATNEVMTRSPRSRPRWRTTSCRGFPTILSRPSSMCRQREQPCPRLSWPIPLPS